MAIVQINPTTNSLSDTITSLEMAYKTQADLTLSEYDTTAAPQVQAGGIFANNGSQFENNSDVTPAGYDVISNSTTFYLYYDADSTELFIYSDTVPTWDDDKQGWYNSNNRAFFSMYKDSGGTLYQDKTLLTHEGLDNISLKNITVEDITVDNGITFPALGAVGTLIIASSDSWSLSTEYLPGTTVAGNTLVYDSTESGSNNSFSARAATNMEILVSAETTLSLTGTWRLLSRVWRDSDSTVRPIGLFQRIA